MLNNYKAYKSIAEIFIDYLLWDIKDVEVQRLILAKCYGFLEDKINSENDFLLFSIDIGFDKVGDCLTLKGNNLISSLWLIGVYPKNPVTLSDSITYSHKNVDYVFNPKNKKLTIVNGNVSK